MTGATADELLLYASRPRAGVVRLDLAVPGVRCGGCIAKVERAVRGVPGVQFARVNFTTKRLSVEWSDGKAAPGQVLSALEAAGFEARPFAPCDAAATEETGATRRLLRAMAVAGFAMMNIMLLSVSVWSGATGATRDLFHLLSAAIAIPTLAYAGMPFFRSAADALSRRRTNMDVPISIGVLLATGLSLHETLTGGAHAWFDGVVMLLFFLLVGRYLDSLMRDRARSGVAQLLKSAPRGATLLASDGTTEWRPIESVAPGMRILVAAGERIPVDGVVEAGTASVDRSLVTGESLPERVAPGDRVLGGTLNMDAPMTVRATAVGEASFLGEMLRLMEAAEGGRSAYVRLADRASRLYAPFVHLVAALTAVGWLLSGASWHMALTTAIAVLIITCPCALGLAVPAVQVTAAGLLARRGVLVKDGSALERLAETDTVVFDKTGTLTLGCPVPDGALPLAACDLALAAGLAVHSRHPLAQALYRAARAEGVAPARLEGVREVPGLGLESGDMRLGRPDWAAPALDDATGGMRLAFRRGDGPGVLIRFRDALRPHAGASIDRLRSLGMEIRILSGDGREAVAAAAEALGVGEWLAEQTPSDKLAAIAALGAAGHRVLMVGDGLNDAPALAAGHASMAPASASDVGQTAADLVFMGDSLAAVPEAVRLARRSGRAVVQNFVLAIGYNLVAVPLAVLGHATPLIAAIAMSTSSLIVVANALRLRWGRA
jgi:Cu2+-exporting ATPase